MNREKAQLIEQMHAAQEQWSMALDALDGMVRQTMERGWTPEQARGIVYSQFAPNHDGGDAE